MRYKPPHERDLVEQLESASEDPHEDLYIDPQLLVVVPQDTSDKGYELVPDRVLPLPKDKYDRYEAYFRFAEIAQKHRYHLIGVAEDARNWVFKVLDEVDHTVRKGVDTEGVGR